MMDGASRIQIASEAIELSKRPHQPKEEGDQVRAFRRVVSSVDGHSSYEEVPDWAHQTKRIALEHNYSCLPVSTVPMKASKKLDSAALISKAKEMPMYGSLEEASSREQLLGNMIWFALAREKRRLVCHDKDEPSDIHKLPGLDDEVLKKHKFCNLRREHDRVSRGLLEDHRQVYIDMNTGGQMSSEDFNNLLYRVLLGRFLHDDRTLSSLGEVKLSSASALRCRVDPLPKGQKYTGAYVINPQYSNYGATLEDVLFKWLPVAVSQSGLADRSEPVSIDEAVNLLNAAMAGGIREWLKENPDHKHTIKGAEYTFSLNEAGDSVEKKNAQGLVVETKKLSGFKLSFIFSQALMDLAHISEGRIVKKDSVPLTGPGSKNAIELLSLAGGKKVKTSEEKSCQKYITDMSKELGNKESRVFWPEKLLGSLGTFTLEHLLCEWVRWLKIKYLGDNGKPYPPAGQSVSAGKSS